LASEDWDLPEPHVHEVLAAGGDIDGYGHVNNAVYVRWLDLAAWSHSTALGLGPDTCIGRRAGMAVLRTQVHYLAPAFAADRIRVGTWIVGNDGRLRVSRRFQLRNARDGRCLVRALIHYVCIDLDSGRPRRMPPDFVSAYRVADPVRAAMPDGAAPFAPGVEPPDRPSGGG
jgi:acyl-CoA thioester hydrolase